MKTIDPNLAHQMAYKKVKLTFQQWAYKELQSILSEAIQVALIY